MKMERKGPVWSLALGHIRHEGGGGRSLGTDCIPCMRLYLDALQPRFCIRNRLCQGALNFEGKRPRNSMEAAASEKKKK